MWLLTCDGDLFGGKRVWLRPGSTHLLGRTTGRAEGGEHIRYIDHKSVSRKHLLIIVGEVKGGDSSKLHARSEIKVTDGSKIGTTLNGEKFSNQTKILDSKEYTIKLGSYEHLFHLSWHPMTLSFTSLSKKSNRDPLAAQREKLEETDIKVLADYVTNETTHVISKKRNTPAGLQALVQGRWLVTDSFVDALASAMETRGADGNSLLEEDFDGNWPNEKDHFVPAGNEPQPRPNEYLKPNLERNEVFKDYVLLFLSQSQYDTLLPVITSGGGKALLRELREGVSRFEDVVNYVKELAGHKDDSRVKLSQQSGRGVAVVRLNERDGDWREFMRAIDRALDQRSIEQNEFLDAILTVDASSLRRQLKEASDDAEPGRNPSPAEVRPPSQQRPQEGPITVVDSPPAAEQEPPRAESEHEKQASEEPATASKRRNRRIITQSRFKGFDDFDPSQFARPASGSPEPSFNDREPSQAPSVQSIDVDEPSQAPRTQQNSRKRRAPVQEDDEAAGEEDIYASILTGHAAMKRRRTEAVQNGGSTSIGIASAEPAGTGKASKTKKEKKEMDVMAEVQARRQREEEARRKDEESRHEALDGIDIKELKNLAIVEEMDIPVRERPARRADEDGRGERWDPAWNGRKNFKKFCPQGQRRDGPRLQRVIVTLEEMPRKGHGIGEEYWLNRSNASNRSKSKSQSQSQSVRQGRSHQAGDDNDDDDDNGDSARFRRRLQNSREEDDANAAAAEILPEEIAGRARDRTWETAAAANNATPSQTFGTDSQRKAAGKRPAAQQGGGPPAKKARQSRLAPPIGQETLSLGDEDEDELKFRRRRR